jgi:CheY-like chemotaxis protein
VVDDEGVNRRLHRRMLERLGCRVSDCSDGDEVAAAMASASPPVTVVMMDILMPRMNGVESCAQLRAAGWRGLVLAATANASGADAARYLRTGFDAVLTKPFAAAQLRDALHAVLTQPEAAR